MDETIDEKAILKYFSINYNGGDFRKYLKLEYFDEHNPTNLRIFRPIKIKKNILEDAYISIQASRCHYCYPQRTTGSLDEYKSMEIAFRWDENLLSFGDAYAFILKKLPKDLVDSISLCNDGTIFSNVPVEDIQKLVELIC